MTSKTWKIFWPRRGDGHRGTSGFRTSHPFVIAFGSQTRHESTATAAAAADGRGEAGVAGVAGAAHLHDDDDQEEEEEGPEGQLARSRLEPEPHRIRE